MYYVYRYIDNDEIIYVGITNDLNRRYYEHKSQSTWLNDKLQYQFIKVEDDNVAKMFEEYLINRDNPKENIVGKNKYDTSYIQFNIKEDWKNVNLKKKKTNMNKIKSEKTPLSKEEKLEFINQTFHKLLKESSKDIVDIYYDEYEFLTIILKFSDKFNKLLNFKCFPYGVIQTRYNKNLNYIVFQFNREIYLNDIEKESYLNLFRDLNVNIFTLDKNYIKNVISCARDELEKKYISLIESGYLISIINIKNNIKQEIPINTILDLFGGIKSIRRLEFAMLLEYRKENLLFYYEETKYSQISDSIKRQFPNQYYLLNKEDYKLLNYMIYKKDIINKMHEVNWEYYCPTELAFDIDISKYIFTHKC